MDAGVPRRKRARPVADAPIDALLARTDDLTKGWLVALLEQTPLEGASAILAADLVRDGPRVCDAVVRALADDADLRRLEPGGALEQLIARTGDLPGAVGAAAASGAIDALHAVIWSALRDELSGPEPEQISELAQRLALVIELVRGAALRQLGGEGHGAGFAGPARERVFAGSQDERSFAGPQDPGAGSVRGPEKVGSGPEEVGLKPVRGAPEEVPDDRGSEQVMRGPEPGGRAPEALWIGAFQEEVARADRAGAPLSLLLVEMDDGDRVRAVEPQALATATLGRFAQTVRDTVRRPDIIASETDTRVWVIARETGRSGALALASRLAHAVRSAEPWRGAPMTVTIGVGVLGEDGRDADSLIAAAEESQFAAAASGIEVAGAGSGEGERRQRGNELEPR